MSTPTLDDERVQAMRGAVMATITADQQQRGRRTRRVVGGLGALALVVVVGGIGTSLVQPTSNDSSSDGSASSAADLAAPGLATPDLATPGLAAPEIAPADDGDTGASSGRELAERQVIVTGRATVVAGDPRREATRISTWVERLGGRVDVRDENGTGDDASARLTVRVPSDQVDAAVERLADSGRVDSVSLQEEDVTSSVVDLDARIRALRISVDRLETILAEADSSDQVITAENALTDRQQQLESLTGQRAAVGEDVALARIDIELVAQDRPTEVDPGGFRGGLTSGWNALVATVNGVVEIAGVLAPWAALLLLGYGLLRLVRRLRG